MEKDLIEVMDEEMVTELESVNSTVSKAKIIGIAALASSAMVLVAFRKKIAAKIENSMVKRLTKKGYTVEKPELQVTSEDEKLFSDIEE